MRLLNTSTLKLQQFPRDSPVEYAILSHTWGDDECTFQDISSANAAKREGYKKIKFCCEQAVKDGLKWAWVDTCCIDKANLNELTEAINSMYRWYKDSKVCYAYLTDVTNLAGLAPSRWFTRGWTLQELIAPKHVRFYSSNWTYLGSKSDLADKLHGVTGIDISVLLTGELRGISVARKMSWAAKRQTTLIEDLSYSLVGIFGVVMPFIYGEGMKAFLRLQQEIMRVSDDQSLFAWGAPKVFHDMNSFPISQTYQLHNIFADSPADFLTSYEILKANSQLNDPPPVIQTTGIVRTEYPVYTRGAHEFILISCTTRNTPRSYIGIPLKVWGDSFYARCGPLVLIPAELRGKVKTKVLLLKEPPRIDSSSSVPVSFQIVRVPNKTRPSRQDQFMLDEVYCMPHTSYSSSEHSIAFSPQHRGQQAALFFKSTAVHDPKRESAKAFAIILGYTDSPWAIFVSIMPDSAPNAKPNLPQPIRTTCPTTNCYMNKSQLKDTLSRKNIADVFRPEKRHFDQLLSVSGPRYGERFGRQGLGISVDLDIESINLVEKAAFVSIDIYEVAVDPKTSKPQFANAKATAERRQNYRPYWMVLDKLEWFLN